MKKLLLIACAAVLLISCKKDEGEKTTIYPDYANLKVGNYWIYQRFKIDTTGAETALDKYDSCYIEKDTVINGTTYCKMTRPRLPNHSVYNYYWRDSLGYVVDTAGIICFSAEDFTTVFDTTYHIETWDTVFVSTSRMVDKDRLITTPAGDFVTRTFQVRYDLEEWLTPYSPRYINKRYSKDIGIICETLDIYSSDPAFTERRLVRYGTRTK